MVSEQNLQRSYSLGNKAEKHEERKQDLLSSYYIRSPGTLGHPPSEEMKRLAALPRGHWLRQNLNDSLLDFEASVPTSTAFCLTVTKQKMTFPASTKGNPFHTPSWRLFLGHFVRGL